MEQAREQEGSEGTPENYLLYWRKRRHLSLSKLAARLATVGSEYASANTLNRWEKGETPLPQWAIPALARVFKISDEELLHGPREADPTLPVNVSAAYTGLDLEIAERVISMGYTSWIASRPDDARQATESIVPWLETMQRRAVRSTQARQCKRILARGYELMGALALDQLANDTALAHFRRALTVSEELGDTNLITAHMTQLGDAYRRKGDKELAIDLMEAALQKAKYGDRATHGYVLQMLAYTYADAGDEENFDRHIGEAINLLGHSGEGEGAAKRDFIPFEVLEIYGKAKRDFGQPTEAIHYLDQAEQALISRPNVPRWHAALTISKAQALCDAGELESGVEAAMRGLLLAQSYQSPRQMNRVRKLMHKLDDSRYAKAPALLPLRELVRDVYLGQRNPLDWHPAHALT